MKRKSLFSIAVILSIAIFLGACSPFTKDTKDNVPEDTQPKAEYSVTFEPENGESAFVVTYKEGEDFIFPTTPVKLGYIFNGWYLDNISFKTRFNDEYIQSTGVTQNITVFGKWVIEEIEDSPGEHLILSMINNSKIWVKRGTLVVDYEIDNPKALINEDHDENEAFSVLGRLILGIDEEAQEDDSGISFTETIFAIDDQTAGKTLDEIWEQKENYSYTQIDLYRDILNLKVKNKQSLNSAQTLLGITDLGDSMGLEILLFTSPRAVEDELELGSEEWHETLEMMEDGILSYKYDKINKTLSITLIEEVMDAETTMVIDLNTMTIVSINYNIDMNGIISRFKINFRLGSDINFIPPVKDAKIKVGLEDLSLMLSNEIIESNRLGFAMIMLFLYF